MNEVTGTALHPAGVAPASRASAPYEDPDAGLISLANIRAMLWRQRLVLLGVTVAALLFGFVATLLMTPLYSATATVRVDYAQGQIIDGQELTDSYLAGSEVIRYLETLAQEIGSRRMALRVAEQLDLHNSSDFVSDGDIENAVSGSSEEALEAHRLAAAADVLLGNIEVTVPTDSRIFSITYHAEDPVLAAEIANGYAENFLRSEVDRSLGAYSYARDYLEGQIVETRNNLREAEIEANEYARANQIVGQSLGDRDNGEGGGATSTLTVSNLQDVNAQYTQARSARISAEERWRMVENTPALRVPEALQSPVIQNLRTQRAQVSARISDLRERYQDDYPDIREAIAELEVLDEQIATIANDAKGSIRDAYLIAARQERALRSEVERVSEQTLDEQERRVQYNLIDRNAEAYRIQLANLLARYNEVSAAANLQTNEVSLIDSATIASVPYSPSLARNMALALVLGLALALALALLREIFDDRLRSIEDVEARLGLPALGQTPNVQGSVSQEMRESFSPLSEAYSTIRATLDFAVPKNERRVIQFTSSLSGEGKSTTAIATAMKYASGGKKVLLIDLDLRRPAIAKTLGYRDVAIGVVDVLHSRTTLADALLPGNVENLDVLPLGKAPPNPVELLSSGLLHEFLTKETRDYDVVICDSSPVMGIADAPLLSRFVDAVIFIVEANRAHFGSSRQAIRRMRDAGANLVGAVLTKYRALDAGESYDYQYNYYHYESEET